jgi:lysophospholipase L1-like esterase
MAPFLPALHRIKTALNGTPYRILALGDSVIWGQGVAERHRFTSLIARHYNTELDRPVELITLAHSGAILREPFHTDPWHLAEEQPYLHGEVPRSGPSVATQLAIARGWKTPSSEGRFDYRTAYLAPKPWDAPSHLAHKAKLAAQLAEMDADGEAGAPQLIFVDGGINDIGALESVFGVDMDALNRLTQEKIAARSPGEMLATARRIHTELTGSFKLDLTEPLERITRQMTDMLTAVGASFPGTRIVVTGYFPVFTTETFKGLDSKQEGRLADAMATILLSALERRHDARFAAAYRLLAHSAWQLLGRQYLIDQSTRWIQQSDAAYQHAATEANAQLGWDAAIYVRPPFGPEHGAYAPECKLHTFTFKDEVIKFDPEKILEEIAVDDVRYTERIDALRHYYGDTPFSAEDAFAAVAHPTLDGHRMYAQAILRALAEN